MLQRLTGIVIMVFGIALAFFGVYAMSRTDATAALLSTAMKAQNTAFDVSLWSTSSYIWSAVFMCAGAWVVGSGAFVARHRPSGFLLLAAAALLLAVFPWAFAQSRIGQYAFGPPTLGEAAVFGSVAVVAFLTFFAVRQGHVGS